MIKCMHVTHAGTDDSSVLVALVYTGRPWGWRGANPASEQYHVIPHPPSDPVLDWMDSVLNPAADFQKLLEHGADSVAAMHAPHASKSQNGNATPPPRAQQGGPKAPVLTLSDALAQGAGLRMVGKPFSAHAFAATMHVGGTVLQWLQVFAISLRNIIPEEMLPLFMLGATFLVMIFVQNLLNPNDNQDSSSRGTNARGGTRQTGSTQNIPNGNQNAQNSGNSRSADRAQQQPGMPSLLSGDVRRVARHYVTGSHRKAVRAALASLLRECPHVTLVGDRGRGGSRGALGVEEGDSVRRVVLVVDPGQEPGEGGGAQKGGLAGWFQGGLRRRTASGEGGLDMDLAASQAGVRCKLYFSLLSFFCAGSLNRAAPSNELSAASLRIECLA